MPSDRVAAPSVTRAVAPIRPASASCPPGHDAGVETVWDGGWTVVVLSNYDAPAGMTLAGPILGLLTRQGAARGTASR